MKYLKLVVAIPVGICIGICLGIVALVALPYLFIRDCYLGNVWPWELLE